MKQLSMVLCATVLAGMAQAHAQELVKLWETEASLKVPESVLFDAERNVLYVTNIDGEPWGDDDRGSIGKLNADGKIVQVDWVKGLSAPKGMALRGQRLYVGDVTEVVVVDVEKGAIESRIPITDAQGLNDVTIDDSGVVYVSDSKGKKVYAIRDGQAEAYLEDLRGPNGVLFHEGSLYVLDGEGLYQVQTDRSLQLLADGMPGGVDGVEPVGDGGFVVSCWAGRMHHISAKGKRTLLLDTSAEKINTADIDYDPKTRTVFVPTFFKNTVVAYRLE